MSGVRDDADGFGRDGGLTFEQRAALVRLDPDMTPRHVIEEDLPPRPAIWPRVAVAVGCGAWLLVLLYLVIGARP